MDKIICVGKNYVDHAREMGGPIPSEPVIFFKPPSAVRFVSDADSAKITLPAGRGEVHYECEIVLRLNDDLRFSEFTLGLDLTLRDLQANFKKSGQPWELAKVFESSAIVGPFMPIRSGVKVSEADFMKTEFRFLLDGELRQKGQGLDMRFSPEEILNFLKSRVPLRPGDLLFTGTPAGVGPLIAGQTGEMYWGERLIAKVEFSS